MFCIASCPTVWYCTMLYSMIMYWTVNRGLQINCCHVSKIQISAWQWRYLGAGLCAAGLWAVQVWQCVKGVSLLPWAGPQEGLLLQRRAGVGMSQYVLLLTVTLHTWTVYVFTHIQKKDTCYHSAFPIPSVTHCRNLNKLLRFILLCYFFFSLFPPVFQVWWLITAGTQQHNTVPGSESQPSPCCNCVINARW